MRTLRRLAGVIRALWLVRRYRDKDGDRDAQVVQTCGEDKRKKD